MNAFAAPRHDLSVFINCPFSGDYGPYLDAVVFTVLYCGFEPRSALETEDTDELRVDRIVDSLRSSRFSIHDLSLIYGDTHTGIARQNMPLELGMAIAMKLWNKRGESALAHNWTALVLDGSPYHAAISDLAGYDLKRYKEREDLVKMVMAWLVMRPDCPRPESDPNPRFWRLLGRFDQAIRDKRTKWTKSLPWGHVVKTGREIIEKKPTRNRVPGQ